MRDCSQQMADAQTVSESHAVTHFTGEYGLCYKDSSGDKWSKQHNKTHRHVGGMPNLNKCGNPKIITFGRVLSLARSGGILFHSHCSTTLYTNGSVVKKWTVCHTESWRGIL